MNRPEKIEFIAIFSIAGGYKSTGSHILRLPSLINYDIDESGVFPNITFKEFNHDR